MGTIHTIGGSIPSTSTSSDQLEESLSKRPRIEDVIAFTDDGLQNVQVSHVDSIVILLTIVNYDLKRILVDNGSSTDILYYDAFVRMSLSTVQLRSISAPLIGFTRTSVPVEGAITLPLTVGTKPYQKTLRLTLLVIKVHSTYNAILGCPGLNAFRAMVSTYHLLVKFPTPYRVGEMRGDQLLAR